MTASFPPAWQALTTQPDGLSESPFWHPHEQRLYWVDIPGRRLARVKVRPDTQAPIQTEAPVEYWPVPEEPGCMAPVQGGGIIVALRDGIYLGTTWGGNLTLLAPAPYDTTRLRFNDGKCDAQGRFWAGSLYEPKDQALGTLYMRDGQGLHAMQGGVTTANGLAWSPDGRTAYWADTAAHQVRAFDVDAASGQLSNSRVFYQATPKPAGPHYGGRPDGATVDAQGNYYSAMYEGKRIVKFSPQGEVLAEIETPVQCPTMPCFGGDDLKTLFITTSRNGRSDAELAAMPQSGCVFALRVDVPGMPVNFFRA